VLRSSPVVNVYEARAQRREVRDAPPAVEGVLRKIQVFGLAARDQVGGDMGSLGDVRAPLPPRTFMVSNALPEGDRAAPAVAVFRVERVQ